MPSFGKQLKAWRDAARLTQTGLAKAARVSVPYLSNLERDFSANTRSGKPRASAEICKRLADALGVPADDVLVAAGHAPENNVYLGNVRTTYELLAALEKLPGFEGANFTAQFSKEDLNALSPEAFREIVQLVELGINQALERQRRRLSSASSTHDDDNYDALRPHRRG